MIWKVVIYYNIAITEQKDSERILSIDNVKVPERRWILWLNLHKLVWTFKNKKD